jgi:peptidoglycan hydrolase CwlO-like protein
LFVIPPKPSLPWKKSDWEKKKNAIEAAKKEYLENIQNLNAFFATEKTKLSNLKKDDSKLSSGTQELYSNCKRFTDGIATKVAQVANIQLPK